jgi:hypothetical protein
MLATLILAVLVGPARAQEDDDLDDLDDEIELGDAPAPKPAPAEPAEPDSPPVDGDDEDEGLDDFRDPDADDDLLGDEPVNPDSGDSEAVFRAAQTRLQKLEADEELAGWEAYLEQYPNSAYRKRIETRMEELTDAIYENGAGPTGGTGPRVDALDAEIGFAQPMQLENIDPRSRIQIGFEWGLPSYVNLIGDVEYQLARTFSIHGGVRRRYLGWNVEAGARWALVKSTRTDTIVSLLADVRMNTIPAYPGLRPQLAIGKRFGKVDAQIQGGVDFGYRTWLTADGVTAASGFHPTIVGGANVFYAASERVGAFLETSTYMRHLSEDGAFEGGMFRFNVVSFGLKFFPGNKPERNQEVNFGATVPYTVQYWQFHSGSVMGQYNYYL